jgi:PAS domain S-box-containing protein
MTALPSDLAVRILGGSSDAIVVCDPLGRVRFWNRGAERIFGFSHGDAMGASLDLIIPEPLRARHWAAWKLAMSTGQTRYGEGDVLAVPALHRDGRQISIEFSIQLLKGQKDQIEWVVAIIRDVTERYARDKELRLELEALRAGHDDPR